MNQHTILPFEIVCLIAKQISRKDYYQCALINRQFYSAINPQLWQTIKITTRQAALRFLDSVIEAKNPVGAHVRHLTLDGIYWRDSLFLRMVKHLRGLKTLCVLDGQGLTYTSLHMLPQHCPHLTDLTFACYHLTQRSLDMLVRHYPRLRVLELLDCTSDDALQLVSWPAVAYSLKKLTIHSNVKEVQDDSDNDNDDVDDHMVGDNAMDLAGFSRLTYLDVYGNTFSPRRSSLFTAPPTTVHCPLLQCIQLRDDFQVDSNQLIRFVASHPRLKNFTLEQGLCTNHVLDAIATFCPHIVMVRVRLNPSITALAIRRLIQNCRFLVILDITYCDIESYHFPELDTRYSNGVGNLHLLDWQATDTIRRHTQDNSGNYNQGDH